MQSSEKSQGRELELIVLLTSWQQFCPLAHNPVPRSPRSAHWGSVPVFTRGIFPSNAPLAQHSKGHSTAWLLPPPAQGTALWLFNLGGGAGCGAGTSGWKTILMSEHQPRYRKGKHYSSNSKEGTGDLSSGVSPGAGKATLPSFSKTVGLRLSCRYTLCCCSWASPYPKVTWQHCRGTGTETSLGRAVATEQQAAKQMSQAGCEPGPLHQHCQSCLCAAGKTKNCRGFVHYFC